MPSRPSHRRLRALFAGFLLVQVLHLGEHVVQMVQLHLLGWPAPTAKGVVSALDVEKVHAVWNVAVLLGLGWLLRRGAGSRWLIVAFGWAILHSAEHGYLLTRALLSGLEGQPGILGEGGLLATAGWTAAGFTTWSRPTVHFFWNLGEVALLALAYAAVVYPGWRVVPDIRWAAAAAAALIGFVLLPDRGDVQPGLIRYVNATDPICGGHTPCYATIQAAVTAALAARPIMIQAGTYVGAGPVQGKNSDARAERASRIVIEGRSGGRPGSVVLGRGRRVYRRLRRPSSAVEVRHDTRTHDHGRRRGGDRAPGGQQPEPGASTSSATGSSATARPSATAASRSNRGNPDTLIANNLIYGNGRNGIAFLDADGGPHYVVGNTIHGNAWSGVGVARSHEVFLVNNLITGNGDGHRLHRRPLRGDTEGSSAPHRSGIRLFNNLVCGNRLGEIDGPALDGTDAGNLTPTGREGPGSAPARLSAPSPDRVREPRRRPTASPTPRTTSSPSTGVARRRSRHGPPHARSGLPARPDLRGRLHRGGRAGRKRPRHGDRRRRFDIGAIELAIPDATGPDRGDLRPRRRALSSAQTVTVRGAGDRHRQWGGEPCR